MSVCGWPSGTKRRFPIDFSVDRLLWARLGFEAAILEDEAARNRITRVPVQAGQGRQLGGRKRHFRPGAGSGCRCRLHLGLEIHLGDALRQLRRVGLRQVAQRRDAEALLGIAQQRRTIAGVRATMIDGLQSAMRAVGDAGGVVDVLSVVEAATLLHGGDERGAADHRVLKVRVPLREILGGRQQAGRARGIEVRDAQLERPTLPGVAVGLVPDDFRKVVAEVRVGHAQRLEDALVGELPERLAARAVHDHREERVAAVGIQVPLARREVELPLPRSAERARPRL